MKQRDQTRAATENCSNRLAAAGLRCRSPVIAVVVLVFFAVLLARVLAANDELEASSWFDDLASRETLTGDWAGKRTLLEEKGLSFEFAYSLDLFSNLSGGERRRTVVLGNVDLLLTLESEPLLGWPGGTFFIYGLGNHGSDPSASVGDLQVTSNIEAFDTWKLYEAWYQQDLAGERLSLLVGLYDLNSEFDVIPAAEVLLNSSFGIGADFSLSGRNGPSIFPTTSLGARVEVHPLESLYARAVVMDGVPGDPEQPRGTRIELGGDDGLLLAAELGYVHNPIRDVEFTHAAPHQAEPRPTAGEDLRRDHFGKYALGVWGYTSKFEELDRNRPDGSPETRTGTYGVYVLGEQRVYVEEDRPSQGLTVFAHAGAADDRVNTVEAYLGAGLVYRGLFPGRRLDRLALGAAAAHLSDDFREAARRSGSSRDAWEVALELTYRARLAPWLVLQPDFQYVVNPSGLGKRDDAVVVGCRMILSF